MSATSWGAGALPCAARTELEAILSLTAPLPILPTSQRVISFLLLCNSRTG